MLYLRASSSPMVHTVNTIRLSPPGVVLVQVRRWFLLMQRKSAHKTTLSCSKHWAYVFKASWLHTHLPHACINVFIKQNMSHLMAGNFATKWTLLFFFLRNMCKSFIRASQRPIRNVVTKWVRYNELSFHWFISFSGSFFSGESEWVQVWNLRHGHSCKR